MIINIDKNDPDIGRRLDLFLSIKIPSLTRSFIKKTIESNKVKLNNEIFYKAGYKVKGLEIIDFPDIIPPEREFKLAATNFDLEILHEDKDYIIINKPVGLLVHPSNQHQTDTVVNKILGYYEKLPEGMVNRPGIVHRLDRDTSGVLVVAKNPKSLWWITKEFADRKVHKRYISISLTAENIKFNEGYEFDMEGFIYRSTTQTKKYQFSKSPNKGRYSLSHFRILARSVLAGMNLIFTQISPVTGRTHQIRVHQKELNMPILGDKLYFPEKQYQVLKTIMSTNNIQNRLYLHSYEINFENYDGKMYSVRSEIPESFTELLKKCNLEKQKIIELLNLK